MSFAIASGDDNSERGASVPPCRQPGGVTRVGVSGAELSNRASPRRWWAAIGITRHHRRAHTPIMWEEVTIARAILRNNANGPSLRRSRALIGKLLPMPLQLMRVDKYGDCLTAIKSIGIPKSSRFNTVTLGTGNLYNMIDLQKHFRVI